MKPGDMVEPCLNQKKLERFVYLGDEIPWSDAWGMVSKPHPFPRGSIGIYLEREIKRSNIFYKILTSDGRVGWLNQGWVKRVR